MSGHIHSGIEDVRETEKLHSLDDLEPSLLKNQSLCVNAVSYCSTKQTKITRSNICSPFFATYAM